MKTILKQAYRKVFVPPVRPEPLMYRIELHNELLEMAGREGFRDQRILEIGPKDGLDSKRLASLSPAELVMIDLPEKRQASERWLSEINCPSKYIESNLMYMPQEQYQLLGGFHLIWCTGVLYHNAEQMRLLRKLYQLLETGGYLVLESATLRLAPSLKNGCFVQIHYPQTYRDTGTITHLPTSHAIKAWLSMVGFDEVHDSDCYQRYDARLVGQRYACICKKNGEDEADGYYQQSGLNPKYRFGDST